MDVRLESPFPTYAWPRVWTWTNQFRSRVADDFSPKTVEEYVESQMRLMHPGLNWGVYRGGDLGGAIWFEQTSPIGGIIHTVFRKDFWGHETTFPALSEAVGQIFDAGMHKMLAVCFDDNHSVRGMAKRFGMQQEGLLRGMTIRGGKPVDMVIFGMTKEEWYGTRNGSDPGDHRGTELRSGASGGAAGQKENDDGRQHSKAVPGTPAATV